MSNFSLEEYCDSLEPSSSWFHLHESSRAFLEALNLPAMHPFCTSGIEFPSPNVPPMGPMLEDNHHSNVWDVMITFACQALPALYAMGELWLRLFASALAPLGICHLVWIQLSGIKQNKAVTAASCLLSVASSVVLLTDTYYVLQYGPRYGASLLCLSSILSFRASHLYKLTRTKSVLVVLWLMALHLVSYPLQFGGRHVPDSIKEGLYYSENNSLVSKIVQHWPEESRIYSVETGATPWMPTGDSRTGLPFLLNFWHAPPWNRVYLETDDDEVVALDVCFPSTGHDATKAVYLILHGLNGGSEEEYIKDLVHRRSEEGHTCVVMVARGLMDLPVKGWNVFHGARVDDVHVAAQALRRALLHEQKQLLVGVGYSMGGIVISNYVARSGQECALDAAMAVSGGLDMRFELGFDRAMRLWQPLLVTDLRQKFILGKFGERYRHRLSQKQMLELMRAFHVSDVDEQAVVTYNGFDNITHYYSEMSALGDVPIEHYNQDQYSGDDGRIANVSVPFCVLHALDDPLITWRAVASKEGLLHPTNLVQTGSGNVMMLLTKSGGHVGWPTGWLPHLDKWKWMSNAVKGYVDAVVEAKST